jgi:metallo-beta-lactamase class B
MPDRDFWAKISFMISKIFNSVALILFILTFTFSAAAQIRNDFDRGMNGAAEPFTIIGNIHYVGASDVAVFLITTPKGHILLDGGFEETVPMIEKNIKTLGFDLEDVKILLINHEHYDHAGGLKLLKDKTGAKLYAGREAAKQLEKGGKGDFAFGDDSAFMPVAVDKILKDGETVELGGVKLKTLSTPGHTKGATTFTTSIKDGRKKLDVIFLSSLTTLDYDLKNNKNYPTIAADFTNSFARLKKLKPDVYLSSHASFFGLKDKFERLKNGAETNPFIDPQGYADLIERLEKQFAERLEKSGEQ